MMFSKVNEMEKKENKRKEKNRARVLVPVRRQEAIHKGDGLERPDKKRDGKLPGRWRVYL